MASAISSLPVPVSPWINTVASVGATIRAISSTRPRASLLPTMQGTPPLSSETFAAVECGTGKDVDWWIAGNSVAQVAFAAILYSSRLLPFRSYSRLWDRSRLRTTPDGRALGSPDGAAWQYH